MSESVLKTSGWSCSLLFGVFSSGLMTLVSLIAAAPIKLLPYSIHPLHGSGNWFDTLHLATKAYESWFFIFPEHPLLFSIFLGFCFTVFIDRFLSAQPVFHRMPGILTPAVLMLIAGGDVILLSACVVYSMFLFCFFRLLTAQSTFFVAIPLIATVIGVILGQELTFPLALCAVVTISVFISETRDEQSISMATLLQVLFVCLIPGLLVLFLKKEHAFPQYPMTLHIHPIVAPFGPVNQIDRTVIRSLWGPFSQLLLGFSLLLTAFRYSESEDRKSLLLLFVMACILVVDTSFPEELSQLGPITGMSKIFTDLYFIPVTPVVSCVTLIIAVLIGGQSRVGSTLAAIFLVATPLCYPLMISAPATSYPIVESFIKRISTNCEDSRIATSPSYDTIVESKLFYLCNKDLLPKKILLTEKVVSVTSSLENRPKRANRIIDGDLTTRWHTRQEGNEWIQVDLKMPMTVAGIQLLQSKWPGNSPESIIVRTATTCEADLHEVLHWETRQSQTLYLTDDGYPFASSNGEVAGFWKPTSSTGCIRIEQTGKTNRPWSVAGIALVVIE